MLLTACGGEQAPRDDERQRPLARRVPDANALLDWAERAYPQYFPSTQANQSWAPYIYRHYPETGNYLGVADGAVAVLGPISNHALMRLGALSDFTCQVYPADCGLPSFTVQPRSEFVAAGGDASFSHLTADATGPVRWQVSRDGGFTFSDVAGAVDRKLVWRAATAADNGLRFRAAAGNLSGKSTSDVATLTVISSTPVAAAQAACAPEPVLPPGTTARVVYGNPSNIFYRDIQEVKITDNVPFAELSTELIEVTRTTGSVTTIPGSLTMVATAFVHLTRDAESATVLTHAIGERQRGTNGYAVDRLAVFSPPLVSTTAQMYPGDSLPSQTSTAAATSTRTRDGKTTGPTTGNVQLTTAKTFVGMETVTTLAGTFRVCKFRHTDVADGRRTTYESWLLAGYGLNIDGWKNTTLPLQAVFINGKLLTRN